MKKAIITGARGFAGSYLAAELLQNDYEVFGIDLTDESISNDFLESQMPVSKSLSSIKIFKSDLSNQDELEKIISIVGDSTIFHLAGSAFVPESWNCPLATLENNTSCTLRILEAVKNTKWKGRFLFISSAEVYGAPLEEDLPITEKTSLDPQSPYALSKLTAEQFSMYYKNESIDIIIARPFNHTGPRQRKSFAIPAFVERIMDAKFNQADSIRVGDLDSVRDFTDVRDVALAYRMIAEKAESGQVYNICSGNPVNIGDVLSEILQMAKTKIDLKVDETLLRPEGSNKRFGNPQKLQDLGWSPQFSLKDTIKDMWDYEEALRKN